MNTIPKLPTSVSPKRTKVDGRMPLFRILILICSFCFSCGKGGKEPASVHQEQAPVRMELQEGYPESLIDATNEVEAQLAEPSSDTAGLQSIISRARTWKPRQVVTVAFKGGTPNLRQQISGAVKPWTDNMGANVNFDFGQCLAASENGPCRIRNIKRLYASPLIGKDAGHSSAEMQSIAS